MAAKTRPIIRGISRWGLVAIASVVGACTPPYVAVPPTLQPVPVQADQLAPITFTRLITRVPEGVIGYHYDGFAYVQQYPHRWNTTIAAGSDALRIVALETMRRHGYNVLGGDNLLFGRDESAKASFQMGATLTRLLFNTYGALAGGQTEVKVGIEWQLYDAVTERVVLTRFTEGYSKIQQGNAMNEAFVRSLANLLADAAFSDALKRPTAGPRVAVGVNAAPCGRGAVSLPGALEAILPAVLMIRSGSSTGSAVVVSPDGYALTAAHVVSGVTSVQVQTRSGIRLPADVIDADPAQDVALIKVTGSGHPCLDIGSAATLGQDLIAIGAPLGEALAFSVTRGIVSGLREERGIKYLQTDASLNPGNSGGPLVSSDGRVLGIVSWKVSGVGVEGLAFGVPIAVAIERLGVRFQ